MFCSAGITGPRSTGGFPEGFPPITVYEFDVVTWVGAPGAGHNFGIRAVETEGLLLNQFVTTARPHVR